MSNKRLLPHEYSIDDASDRHREYTTVRQHLTRALKLGLSATLTVEQWFTTIAYFKNMCAYCNEKPYQVLEHFIPMELGGGTTAKNCVPACRSCNITKGQNSPFRVQNGPWGTNPHLQYASDKAQRIMDRAPHIKAYLESRIEEVVA